MQESATQNSALKPTAIEDKVPVGQKIAYGFGSTLDMWGNWLYPGLVWPVFNIFLGVPPWLISLALCMNRLVDAFADPFIGWMSDNTRSRWGRRRPYILVGGLIAGIGLPGLVWVTPGWSSSYIFGTEIPNYFWYMAVSSAIYIVCVSLYNVPYQSLGAELTPDPRERTSVFSFKTAIQRIPEIAMFTAAAFSTSKVWSGATKDDVMDRLGLMASRTGNWFGDLFASLTAFDLSRAGTLMGNIFGWGTPMPGDAKVNTLLGAQVYTIILGCIMVVVAFLVALFVKERYYSSVVERKQEKVQIGETIWKTLKCRPFRANLSMAFAYAMGTSMVGTLGYYATVYYVCRGDVSIGSLWNTLMGLANSFIGVLGVPVFAALSYRLGKRGGMMCVQISAMFVFLATWWLYTPDIVWLQVMASGLIAFTGSGFWMLYGSIGADIIDYDELEHGKRREGAFTSSGMWIMKVGQAIGIGCSGIILSATGFDAALEGNQSASAIFNIRFYLAVIPIVGLLIALFALSRYGLTDKKVAEIRTALEARRGKV